MIETTQVYKEEIRNLYNRKIYGKVQIDYSDPEIDQGISATADNENHTSYISQIFDGKKDPSFKYISLGSWVLGDTHTLSPRLEEFNKGIQMGFWGSTLSDGNGNFTIPQELLILSQPKPMRELKLFGDSKRNEYPVDFKFTLYKVDDEVIYTETITNNAEIYWNKEIVQVNEVVKIRVTITKWNKPNNVIKIVETFSNIQEIYEGEDIISIKLLEERDVAQSSLSVGNISSNEITVTLNNVDRQFDTGNKNSNLYGLLKSNRKITAWVGTESQLIPLGVFWSTDWNVPEDGLSATTTGRDRLDRLISTEYTNSTVQINKNMYELAEMVLLDGGISPEYYWLDNELKEYVVPYSYFEPQSHREALRKIASACMGQVYCDRGGIIRFEGASFTFNKVLNSNVTTFLQSEFPSETEVLDAYGISITDYFKKNNPSRQSNISNRVVVETQPLKLQSSEELYSSNDGIPIIANVPKVVIIQYNKTPCINVTVTKSGTGTVTDTKIYSWGAEVTVSSTTNGTFNLVANGQPLLVTNKDKIILEDRDSIIDNGVIEYVLPTNPLIQTRDIAEKITQTLLQYYKDPKRDLEMEWRGNPALTLGDIIMVDDYSRGDGSDNGYYYVSKNQLEFSGGLRATLSGRRAL